MRRLDRLIKEAREAAEWRGHKIPRFTHSNSMARAYTGCLLCGKRVYADADPLPNGIEIGGNAVAVDCEY